MKYYPNDGQRFVAWYLRNIHNLDTLETKACITDGAGDKQIDAVYIDNQSSTIYIIQGKFLEVLVLAKNNDRELAGIVINAFSEPFILDKGIWNIVEKMKSRIH